MTKLTKTREELAEAFINILNEQNLHWSKEWKAYAETPVNAMSQVPYRGVNAFYLQLVAMKRDYKDCRWATFNQINQNGLSLNNAKGQGVHVEYWMPAKFDENQNKYVPISWSTYQTLPRDEQMECQLRSKTYTVFNGDLIEGLEPLPPLPKNEISPDELINVLADRMNVPIFHDGRDRAFYRPSQDAIHLPQPEFFNSDYAYNSTALHELAHASGAEHRLNRNIQNIFGSQDYAFEELVAEMTSCFMSRYLDAPQDEFHINNHKAYVQNWIQSIKEDPNVLVKAINEANRAADYLEQTAELQKNLIIENPKLEQIVSEVKQEMQEQPQEPKHNIKKEFERFL